MAKPNKLYVVVDPQEGVMVLQLHKDGAKLRVSGTIKPVAKGAKLHDAAAKAMQVIIESNGEANPALRTAVNKAFGSFKSKDPNGVMFAMGADQGKRLTARGAKSAALKDLK